MEYLSASSRNISGTGRGRYRREKKIKGNPVSPGIGFGRGCFYQNDTQKVSSPAEKHLPNHNLPVLDAFSRVTEQLTSLTRQAEDCFDQDTAALFKAHRVICEELQSTVLDVISKEQLTAKDAIEKCFDGYFDYFNSLNDDYFSDRSNDFSELKQLLLNFLNNTEPLKTCREYAGCQVAECALQNEHILITDELTANVAIRIKSITKGIIADRCGVNSHAAVIARSLDIPVISGIKDPLNLISHQDDILVDGMTGEVIINPCKATLDKYKGQVNQPYRFEVIEPLTQFTVFADIDRFMDVQKAVKVKADGIGLYRTEFEMLGKGRFLREDEQIEALQHVIENMKGKPVYIRLLDLGSDKSAPWLEIEKEDNPALGCRGARLLLSRPDFLKTQARAIASVSQISPVNVIYPMISGPDQFLKLKKIFLEAVAGFKHDNIRHGIMFEVPSACINGEDLYDVIDFGRVGTNDLIQYLFAHDRTSEDFNYSELICDPAVWKVIAALADIANKAGKPLELCGMMVDKTELIPELIKLGITTISIRPENVAAARKAAMSFLNLPEIS